MAKKTIFKRRRKQLPQQELRGRTAMPTIPDDARSLSASTDPMAMLNTQASQMSASMQGLPSGERLTNANVDNEIIDRHRSGDMTDITSFNEAFGTAHKMGLKEFFWRTKQGKVGRYAVKFADASSTSGSSSAGRNQSSTKSSSAGRNQSSTSGSSSAGGDETPTRSSEQPIPVGYDWTGGETDSGGLPQYIPQHRRTASNSIIDSGMVRRNNPVWPPASSESDDSSRLDEDLEAYYNLLKKRGDPNQLEEYPTYAQLSLMPRKTTQSKATQSKATQSKAYKRPSNSLSGYVSRRSLKSNYKNMYKHKTG